MEFTSIFWILIIMLSVFGSLAFLLLLKSNAPSRNIPVVGKIFPKMKKNEYIAEKGAVLKTPNGLARVKNVTVSDTQPTHAKLLLTHESGEEYAIDVGRGNIHYETNATDLWMILSMPEKAIKFYCDIDRNNQEAEVLTENSEDEKNNSFSRLKVLETENESLRGQIEELMRMAADMSSRGESERKTIREAELNGRGKELAYGNRNRKEVITHGAPLEDEDADVEQ